MLTRIAQEFSRSRAQVSSNPLPRGSTTARCLKCRSSHRRCESLRSQRRSYNTNSVSLFIRRERKGGLLRNRRGVGTGSGFGPAAVWKEKFQSVLAEKNKVQAPLIFEYFLLGTTKSRFCAGFRGRRFAVAAGRANCHVDQADRRPCCSNRDHGIVYM